MRARFGPAGNSDSFSRVHRSSLAAPGWIAGRGWTAMNTSAARGSMWGRTLPGRWGGERCEGGGSPLSLHAPYFINLANPDPEALRKTIGYITRGPAWRPPWMGAEAGGHPLPGR